MIRKLLLGDEGEGDDFFLDDGDQDSENENKDDSDVHKVMTFVPKDEESIDEETETPAEAMKRKKNQKKLNKKEGKIPQEKKNLSHFDNRNDSHSGSDEEDKKRRQEESQKQLELLFAGEETDTKDRLKFSKKEFEKSKKEKNTKEKKRKRFIIQSFSLIFL